jgi:hypothetical protein
MITKENIRGLRILDLGVVLAFAFMWFILDILFENIFSVDLFYVFSLGVFMMFVSFCVNLFKKFGIGFLFFVFSGFISYRVNDFGVIGIDKMLVFIFAGVLFEVVFLLFRLEVKNIPLDVVLASSLSAASIPFFIELVLVKGFILGLVNALINLVLLSFLVGLVGSVIGFLIWYLFRDGGIFLKLRYGI